MEVYFDAEFDAIHRHDGCVQCLVSIGIVAVQKGQVLDTYYSLIQPKRFRKLTRIVREMTQLSNEEIRKARTFVEVMKDVEAFLDRLGPAEERRLYSFGPDDKRTIHSHAEYEKCEDIVLFDDAIDLQKVISPCVTWDNAVISSTLSLDDLKYAYGVAGEVVHNALNDALDLMRIHEAYCHHSPIKDHVQTIYERKEAKRLEVKARAQARMMRILHERYDRYDGQSKQIQLYPAVIEQLEFLSEQKNLNGLCFLKDMVVIDHMQIPFSQMTMHLYWQMNQVQITMEIKTKEQIFTFVIPLIYRNASIFENVWRNGGQG